MIQTSGNGDSTKVTFPGHATNGGTTVSRTVAVAACQLSCNLQIFKASTNEWEVYGSDIIPNYVTSYQTVGCSFDFKVHSSLGFIFSPANKEAKVIYLRYKIWDPNSDQGEDGFATIYDPFEVTMNYAWTGLAESAT